MGIKPAPNAIEQRSDWNAEVQITHIRFRYLVYLCSIQDLHGHDPGEIATLNKALRHVNYHS